MRDSCCTTILGSLENHHPVKLGSAAKKGWQTHKQQQSSNLKDVHMDLVVTDAAAFTPTLHGTPCEQAKARLQLVLEAAAKADEALKAKERNEEEAKRRKEEDQATLVEQVKRVKEIEAIESDSFVQQTFRSSKEVKKSVEPSEVKHVTPASGPASIASDPPSIKKEIDPDSIPTAIKYQDDNSLDHPNLFIEKAEAEEKWFKRLIALRQERLMGSPVV
ncbi:serine/Arginine-related protein 53-like [Peromyscus maniculatus bairdii]|uniref:serine/Arginine-related protein 53-like n=1 Tax=Peromyscus maniculatus bairdii TaxID=230844 RepID=UPI003FD2145E